jgi:hypothetical protein
MVLWHVETLYYFLCLFRRIEKDVACKLVGCKCRSQGGSLVEWPTLFMSDFYLEVGGYGFHGFSN